MMSIGVEPLKIVLTPVRNEAWVLRAFLEATSLWADHIIIADQMSTDGSREIAKEYPKVTLVDNDRQEMHQAATRRLLFEEAKKIEGDKILFALDADEFLAGDFVNSDDWKKIINSKANDVFWWRWMNLCGDDCSQYTLGQYFYWAVHVSESLWEGEFPDNYIHEWRLPWPPQTTEKNRYELEGLFSLHFAKVNQNRQRNKERFYQVSTVAREPKKSMVTLFRHYHESEDQSCSMLPMDAYKFYEDRGLVLWNNTDTKDEGGYYTSEVLRIFKEVGIRRFAMLDIWDEDWMKRNNLQDPRNFFQKALLRYLRMTNPKAKTLWVRCMDKVLKIIV